MENKDIIFQATDWGYYHEVQEMANNEEMSKYMIRIFGTTREDKKIYVKVKGFNPYFYVQIPRVWRQRKVIIFIEELKRRVYYKHRNSLKDWKRTEKCKFMNFTKGRVFTFVKLMFYNYKGYRAFSNILLYKEISHRFLSRKPRKYKVYESNLDPILRCMHMRDVEASGWIKIGRRKYEHIREEERTTNEINICTKWTNLEKVEDASISKLIVASFDIECTSGDGKFPQPQRDEDKVIQIGTTFNRYGESKCYYKHMITLKSCAPIEGVEIESYESEKDVLLAWTALIERMNPDVITGYNILGFDYRYLAARSKKLGCEKRFAQLGKIKDKILPLKTKELRSSGLGDNVLYYYDMDGRVQADLFKKIQRDFKFPSYKLDAVASQFIREQVEKVEYVSDNMTKIITKSTKGLEEERYIKIYYNDKLWDNAYKNEKKFKVRKVTKNSIIIEGKLEGEAVELDKYKIFWCQAKDDVTPSDIFKLQEGTAEDRAVIAKYCIQDCTLCNMLMEKLQVLTNNIGMANVCSVPLSYIFMRGQGIKGFSLVAKKCRKLNYLIPVIQKKRQEEGEEEENEGYEGATVLMPKIGLHLAPIPVLDYASLYPRSMIHRNISHECKVDDEKYNNLPGYDYVDISFYNKDGTSTTARYAKKKNGTKGILPAISHDLLSARSKTKKLMAQETDPFQKKIYNGLQLAYKLTGNSLYGLAGARTSAIYYRDIAASTTATGREMLNAARLFAEYIFRKIVTSILEKNYKQYEERMNMLFDKKIDELLGEKLMKYLKNHHNKDVEDPKDKSHLNKPVDYYYLRIFAEKKEELTDENFEDPKKKTKTRNDYIKYIYEEVGELLEGYRIKPECVYGDTDSIFVDYGITKNGKKMTDKKTLEKAIKLGVICGEIINYVLPGPHDLEYEKTFYPWILNSKKRYVGKLFEHDPNDGHQKNMGIVLTRRDNAPIVKIIVGGIVNKIIDEKDGMAAVRFTRELLKNMLSGKYTMDKFIISKTLKAEYKDRTKQAHVVLADRIAERDPGNKPQTNDRIPFVYIMPEGKAELQGDRVEHPDYIKQHGIKIDYLFYITNQIMKPAVQFLEKIVKDADKIFIDYIIRETNRRKGARPISYYFAKIEEESESESEEMKWSKKIKWSDKVVPKPTIKKRRKQGKKRMEKATNEKVKYNKERGGFTLDL